MRNLSNIVALGVLTSVGSAVAVDPDPKATSASPTATLTSPFPLANSEPTEQIAPITLATALQLARARPLDIALASQRVELATQEYRRTRLLWLPNIIMGADYFRHDGGQQNFLGEIVRSGRSTVTVGVGPNIVVSTSEATFAPLAAKQDLLARSALRQATDNDITLDVAEAYFHLQQSRGELAGAEFIVRITEDIASKTIELSKGLAPSLEANRAKVELARRKQAVTIARQRWRMSSAELTRILRLDPNMLTQPEEAPELRVSLVAETETPDALIPVALTNRPELAAHQAVVRATLARLKQERLRPLLPSLALRSTATNPGGSIAYGGFGGGANSTIGSFGSRFDIDVQLLWEFSALGLGNRVRVAERRTENQIATLQLFRMQDQIAAEVVTALAQLKASAERLREAEPALQEAIELVMKSREGMSQTRRTGDTLILLVRPQEVMASLQSLSQATSDYYSAIGDYNRAQFRLYRALGHPAGLVLNAIPEAHANTPLKPQD